MPILELEGRKIYYSFRNHHSPQNLVLIHGAGGTEALWPRGFKKIEQANYYAIDLSGHGKSKGKSGQTIEEFADFIEKFIRNLNLSSVILLGHSMGGAIALELALRQPLWLSKLILLSTGAHLKVNSSLLEKIQNNFEEAIQQIVRWSYTPTVSTAILKEAKEQLLKIDPKILEDDFRACDQFDAQNRIQQIKIPTLIIVGDQDRMTPLRYSETLHQSIKGSMLQVIPEGSHMMILEEPKKVTETITEFLGKS